VLDSALVEQLRQRLAQRRLPSRLSVVSVPPLHRQVVLPVPPRVVASHSVGQQQLHPLVQLQLLEGQRPQHSGSVPPQARARVLLLLLPPPLLLHRNHRAAASASARLRAPVRLPLLRHLVASRPPLQERARWVRRQPAVAGFRSVGVLVAQRPPGPQLGAVRLHLRSGEGQQATPMLVAPRRSDSSSPQLLLLLPMARSRLGVAATLISQRPEEVAEAAVEAVLEVAGELEGEGVAGEAGESKVANETNRLIVKVKTESVLSTHLRIDEQTARCCRFRPSAQPKQVAANATAVKFACHPVYSLQS
jgi:hypothetical protein